MHSSFPENYPFLLESVGHGTAQARYDLLLRASEAEISLSKDYRVVHSGMSHPVSSSDDFLGALNDWFISHSSDSSIHPELPFVGGWFIYLGYEVAGQIEPRLALPPFDPPLPTAFARYCPGAVILDHALQEAWVVSEHPAELNSMAFHAQEAAGAPSGLCDARFVEDQDSQFLDGVDRIKDYILAGDVFQVNLSREWRGQTQNTAADIYASLRQANPGPFSGLLRRGDCSVISSSPERLVRTHAGWVETRPIAGTRPRGQGQAADIALSEELLAHPKERAEHIMLIDLERNDLGRVCAPGTVEVNELMVLESYAHVHHIVSNVRGRQADGVLPGDVIAAVFPGGTITGCPKVRCMEIIAELEGTGRGPYTGAFGYLSRSGDMDLNILIRSMLLHDGQLEFRAGAGIVADSTAHAELAECRSKAAGILRSFA